MKWVSFYGGWTTPDGRRVNRRIGKVRARGEAGGLTRTEAERGLRQLIEAERLRPHRSRPCGVRSPQYEPMATDYQRPGWFTKHVFNPIVAGLTRLGVSLVGSRVLEVRGRKSGEWRRTPVNPLEYEGERYIVAPRGKTQWVRNLRASGEGRLRKGRRIEEFTATELPDDEKVLLLRAYLKKWAWEVGAFFQGVGADAPDDDLRRIAPLHPVFRISRRP